MAKYFYYFETGQEAQSWTPPQDQVWVVYADGLGVAYSSMGSEDEPIGPIEQPVK